MRKVRKEMWETYDGTLFEEEEDARDYELGLLLDQKFDSEELEQKIMLKCLMGTTGEAITLPLGGDPRRLELEYTKDDSKRTLREWIILNRDKLLSTLKAVEPSPPSAIDILKERTRG